MNLAGANVTPMMAQYLEIKEHYPDALLFYRMGDFYEMFFDDAEAAAGALDIALTKRGKHLGREIPMCGVPAHASDGYLLSLIKKGFRVAVCEQLEDPRAARQRGAKAVVKRGVVRLVTPGTLTEDSLLSARRHNFLSAWVEIRGEAAFAWADVSTGAFRVMPCPRVLLATQMARLSPSELLVPEPLFSEFADLAAEYDAALTPMGMGAFDSANAERRLADLFNVQSLAGIDSFSRAEIAAMGGIVEYLDLTQKGHLPLLARPVREAGDRLMRIDSATRQNLELTRNLAGKSDGSLLSVIDRTITSGGARLMSSRLGAPSVHLETIHNRQEMLAFFLENPAVSTGVREALRACPDLERALARLALNRGGPRDLAAVCRALGQAGLIAHEISAVQPPASLMSAVTSLRGFENLQDLLISALAPEPPVQLHDGGMVAAGFDDELDKLRHLRDDGRAVIAEMQAEYVADTDVKSLKIKHNNVLGYFVETPASHSTRMMAPPFSEVFVHRQTTANALRFTTAALSEIESRILNARDRALAIERRVFDELQSAVLDAAAALGPLSRAVAEIDVAAALADVAARENWCRPELDESHRFEIVEGRHPVVESALRAAGDVPFIANDCDLSDDLPDKSRIWLLTGPNMAGKSTFLRQNALIALLAQIGSHVPARLARIGLVSQLFSRVGAADDLARGRSTFMVEMVETAAILNQADSRALVILDEIGRGTATYDGLSIAWATLEQLHDVNKCRALFATHYHELTALSSTLVSLANATVAVREWQNEVVFLHEVRPGAADRSYGIQVARLAGLPEAVIDRARSVLAALEEGDHSTGGRTQAVIDGLPLFSASAGARRDAPETSAIETRLREIHPDNLTPMDALNLIYALRGLLKADENGSG